MVKNYFASLFDPDFPRATDGGASNLRSATERRSASAAGGGGSRKRGSRRMKPGKAKTLGDLPKINS